MKAQVELGDIIISEKHEYRKRYKLTGQQNKVLCAVEDCRTSKLGSHMVECEHCHHQEIRYNSCRDRHCPKCQGSKQAQWVAKLKQQLLPCRYFHLVFTIPSFINDIVYNNQAVMYDILMKAASETLMKVSSSPRFIGAKAGCISILHTWGQNLLFHPHVHMLAPGGGLSEDGWEWVMSGKKFFVPVKVLSKVFRANFMAYLTEAYQNKKINLPENIEVLKRQLYAINWNVYSKKAFGGPGQVISYLGRYTHRVAISNHRIHSFENGKVKFWWKDYRDGNKKKLMEISSLEFIRRFLLHVLPANFYKIRYSGIFANAVRKKMVNKALCLLEMLYGYRAIIPENKGHYMICPLCRIGRLMPKAKLPHLIT